MSATLLCFLIASDMLLLRPQALTLPQKRVELKQPREPLLVVLPHPVVLMLAPPGEATRTLPSNARTRTWAQVAAGLQPSSALSKRPRASLHPPQHEDLHVVETLSSSLADGKGESEEFEDRLASWLQ